MCIRYIVLQPCKHRAAVPAGTEMQCRMPVVYLPDDLSEELNNSESGTINNTQGPGVALYWASDERTRADIYLGLQLDGFKLSSVDPSIKMQFSVKPDVFCRHDDGIDFNPKKDKLIAIRVIRYFQSLFCLKEG